MTIDLSCATRWITLGFERENLARPQEFDFSAWAEEHGTGVPQLLFQRPGEDTPYPVLLTVEGTTATWTPTATDTAIAGEGKAQLSFVVGETVAKNAIFAVLISPSLGASGDPPEGFETWLEELTELAADAQAAAISAGNAETAAETAQGLAEAARDAAADYAGDAQDAAGDAQAAQRNAEAAESAAEAAEGRAAGYANAAAGSAGTAGDAAAAAANAKTAAQTAQGKAEDAQASAVSAKNDAVAAKTAIEDMTATASVADNTPGTPSVTVTKSTIAGHENLDFVFSHVKGPKGDTGSRGVQGPTGPQGPRGYDGYSPTVAVTDISGGHRVTITDKNGDHPFDVMDGDVGDLDAGDVAYDDEETYPADTVGSEISSVKSALEETEEQLVWRLDWDNAVEVVPSQSVSFSEDGSNYKHSGALNSFNLNDESGNMNTNVYAVTWDGTEYVDVLWRFFFNPSGTTTGGKYCLGNSTLLGVRNPHSSQSPFFFHSVYTSDGYVHSIYTADTSASHTISVMRVPVIFGNIREPFQMIVSPGTTATGIVIGGAIDSGNQGVAAGLAAQSTGSSIAIGTRAKTEATASVAIGLQSKTQSSQAVAIGAGASAYRNASAIGMSAVANKDRTAAIGFEVDAESVGQTVLGAYNVVDSDGDYALIVGDGTGDNARHNLLTVAPDGTIVSGGKRIAFVDEASVTVTGTTPSITAEAGVRYVCGEVATLTVTVPASGIVDIIFTSGSTPTVLTVTPPTGITMSWAGGVDPTSLEANTTYEINIADGHLGVAAAWT